MPRYEYECSKCGTFEVTQRISDPPLTAHVCGSAAERRISRTAFALKGSGWYADGYGASKPAAAPACTPSGCEKPGCAAKAATADN